MYDNFPQNTIILSLVRKYYISHLATLGRRSITGPHRDKRHKQPHTRSLLRTILETPINLTCMFLDGGRKPEYPERTHAYTGRTCRLHTEPSRCKVTVLTTTPPCSSFVNIIKNIGRDNSVFPKLWLWLVSMVPMQTYTLASSCKYRASSFHSQLPLMVMTA